MISNDELIDKFSRVMKLHKKMQKPEKLQILNTVFEFVKIETLSARRTDLTARDVCKGIPNIKKGLIKRSLKYLVEGEYLKISKKGRVFFLGEETPEGDFGDTAWGEEDISEMVGSNFALLREFIMGNPLLLSDEDVRKAYQEFGKEQTLISYNKLVLLLVTKGFNFNLLSFKSTAYRYSLR